MCAIVLLFLLLFLLGAARRLRVSLLNQLHLKYILEYPHNELLSRLYVETTQIRLLEFIMLSTHPHAYL